MISETQVVEVTVDTAITPSEHLFGAPAVVGVDPAKAGEDLSIVTKETFTAVTWRRPSVLEEAPISWDVLRQAIETCREIEKEQRESLTLEQIREAVRVFEVRSDLPVSLASVVLIALNLGRALVSEARLLSSALAFAEHEERYYGMGWGPNKEPVPAGWCMASRGWMSTGMGRWEEDHQMIMLRNRDSGDKMGEAISSYPCRG